MDREVVVITGAGSGLGASLARKYSELGYYVCLLGRTKDKLNRTAEALSEHHSIYVVDIASNEEVAKVMQTIKEEVGPVDVLINNAGVGYFDVAENLSEKAVHDMIDINLKGTIFCTQGVLRDMKERNGGTIVNVASTAGVQGNPNETVYCASKYGVRGFTEALAAELEDTGIRVFGAYMGGMRSPFWDGIYEEEHTARLMDTDDVADIIIANAKQRTALGVTEVIIRNKIYK